MQAMESDFKKMQAAQCYFAVASCVRIPRHFIRIRMFRAETCSTAAEGHVIRPTYKFTAAAAAAAEG